VGPKSLFPIDKASRHKQSADATAQQVMTSPMELFHDIKSLPICQLTSV